MKVTKELLEKGRSSNGSWSKKQLQALGVEIYKEFKLKKGWKRKLIGSEISEDNAKFFLSLKDKHLKNEKTGKFNFACEEKEVWCEAVKHKTPRVIKLPDAGQECLQKETAKYRFSNSKRARIWS